MSPPSAWVDDHIILDTLQEPVFVVDADFELIYANQRLATVTDQSVDAICHMDWDEFETFVESGAAALRTAVDAVIRKAADDRRIDVEMAHPDAAPVPQRLVAEARVSRLTVEDHDSAALVVLRDISERKARERELRRFKNAVEHAGYAIFITDPDGTIEYVNPAFEAITGYDAEYACGRTPAFLNSGAHDEAFFADLWRTIKNGDVWTGELINERRSGERFVVQQTIAPIEGQDGTVQAFVAMHDEITDHRLREQQLAVFHRVLRHNLRNKGTAIMGHATMLEESLSSDESREHIDAIQENLQSLLDIGEKAHYVRQILADSLEEHAERTLPTVLERVVSHVDSSYPTAEITLEVDHSEALQVDAKVVPALRELVENAAKHAGRPEPQVTITLTATDTVATVSIADNGPGIPKQDRRVIEMGTEGQLEHGSGLGLWFAYWLLNYVGGDIDIDVDRDGTTVTAMIPLL